MAWRDRRSSVEPRASRVRERLRGAYRTAPPRTDVREFGYPPARPDGPVGRSRGRAVRVARPGKGMDRQLRIALGEAPDEPGHRRRRWSPPPSASASRRGRRVSLLEPAARRRRRPRSAVVVRRHRRVLDVSPGRPERRPGQSRSRRAPSRPPIAAQPDPGADARPRPRAADGHARQAGRRHAPRDRGHDRRPVRRPAAVGPERRPTSCGRRPPRAASRATWRSSRPATRRPSGPSAARACTSSPGRPSGSRCTSTPAARRRRSRCSRSSKGRGSYVYNADGFRWSGERYLWRIKTRFAPHNVYTDGKHLRRLAKRVGAKPVADQKPAWRFGGRRADRAAARGRHDRRPYLGQQDHLPVQPQDQPYLRSVTGEKKQIDAGHQGPDRADERHLMVVHFGPLNDGSHKHRLEAQVTGRARPGSRPTARRSRAPGRRRVQRPRRGSSTRTASRSR